MSPHPRASGEIRCLRADLADPIHARAVVELISAYALDPMGGGKALPPTVRDKLVDELRKRPTVHVLLAFVEQDAVGVAVCIEGFSTFACKPLLNLHDIAVLPEARGRGVGRALLGEVERLAREMGCCKITLEVLSNNKVAQSAYRAAGFAQYELDPAAGQAMFWQKQLPGASAVPQAQAI